MTSTLEFLISAKDEASKIFNDLGDSVDKQKGKFDKFQAGANIALGAVALGVGVFAKDSIEAYSKAEDQQAKLTLAYEKFPALADTNIESLRTLNDELQKKTGYDNDDTAAMQASLAGFGLTGSQIEKLTPLVQDYAARTGSDLASSADVVGKAMLGQGRALKSVGVDFTDTGTLAGNFDQTVAGLSSAVGGYAETMGGTAAGKTKILGAQWEDLQEKAGGQLMPALTKLTDAGIKLTDWIGGHQGETTALVVGIGALGVALGVAANWATIMTLRTGIMAVATGAWKAIQAIATAGQWLMNAAMSANPISLIIIGIIALIAAFVWLWNNNEGFRKFIIAMWAGIQVAFKAVVDWVVNVMVPWFKQAFDNIGKVIGVVIDWVKANWPLLLAIITGPIGLAVLAIVTHWGTIKAGAASVVQWISDRFNGLVSFFQGIPGSIARAASGMWDGIVGAFRSAINTLIRLWNGFHLTIGGGSILGVAIPSVTLTTAPIPYLASGGIVPATSGGRLAVVGEGGRDEAVVPLDQGAIRLHPDTIAAIISGVGAVVIDGQRGALATNQWGDSMQRQSPARGH